jgi:L-lactate dehydrogenase complex protein LldG
VTARADVLARIRAALGDGPRHSLPVRRDYNTVGEFAPGSPVLVDLFEERLVDYKAGVRRTTPDGVASAVATVLSQRAGAQPRIVVPIGLDASWRTDADTIVDDGSLTAAELDGSDGVLTACAVAIAETGTIVLDAQADQGRRAISLVPDLHICVVRTDQIVADVPDALRLLDPTRPLTFISGGSATSDIELKRVEGVHGPRTLEVIIVDQPRR